MDGSEHEGDPPRQCKNPKATIQSTQKGSSQCVFSTFGGGNCSLAFAAFCPLHYCASCKIMPSRHALQRAEEECGQGMDETKNKQFNGGREGYIGFGFWEMMFQQRSRPAVVASARERQA